MSADGFMPVACLLKLPVKGGRTGYGDIRSGGGVPVEFGVLGDVRAIIDGRIVDLGPARQRCVLAALLVDANRVVPNDQLAERVWAGRLPHRAHRTLSSYVSRLRRAVGDITIVSRSGGFVIEVDPEAVDLHRFRSLVAGARTAATLELYEEALALWRGEAFSGLESRWIEAMRVRLDQERLDAELAHADLALSRGRHQEVLAAVTARARAHPADERMAGQLILALYRGGRRADALEEYQRTRGLLVDEYGVDPGAALRELQQRILTDDRTLIVTTEPPRPVIPRQLSTPPPFFVGRERELAVLSAHRTGTTAITGVSGPGGVGKTWLALHWAHRNAPRFPDGQLHVNLHGFAPGNTPVRPTVALRGFLGALGAEPAVIPEDLAGQTALYRSMLADKRMLIVLDNARDAAQVEPLLPASPTCAVIVTSRNRLTGLRVRGARVVDLPMLDDTEARQLLAWHLGQHRAAAEPAAFDELVGWCAGLPLAVSIVAARAGEQPWIPLEPLTRDLRSSSARLDALDTADITANLRAVFSWSHQALDADAARMFDLLGLVTGPDFAPAAAAALAGVEVTEATRHLRTLSTANLVEQHTPDRYRFHDLVRLFAAERARSMPDRSGAWARLVEHYLAISSSAIGVVEPSLLQLTATHLDIDEDIDEPATRIEVTAPLLDAEMPNLLAVLAHAVTEGPYPATWLLSANVRTLAYGTGRRDEWLKLCPAVLEAADRHGVRHLQALVHHGIGAGLVRAGRGEEGVVHLRAAVGIARECGWRAGEAYALAHLGGAMVWTGPLAEAIDHTGRAAKIFADLGDVRAENRALDALGHVHHHLGDPHGAQDHFRRALRLSKQFGLRFRYVTDLIDLGSTYFSLGRMADAEELLRQSLDHSQSLGYSAGQAWAHLWLSRSRWQDDSHEQARIHAAQAVELAKTANAPFLETAALIALADAETELARPTEAEHHLTLAQQFAEKNGLRWHQAEALIVSARLHARADRISTALQAGHQALSIAEQTGHRLTEIAAWLILAEVHASAGQQDRAKAAARQVLAHCEETGHGLGITRARKILTN
jgi:DNA-binding SARP family transcriptional activator